MGRQIQMRWDHQTNIGGSYFGVSHCGGLVNRGTGKTGAPSNRCMQGSGGAASGVQRNIRGWAAGEGERHASGKCLKSAQGAGWVGGGKGAATNMRQSQVKDGGLRRVQVGKIMWRRVGRRGRACMDVWGVPPGCACQSRGRAMMRWTQPPQGRVMRMTRWGKVGWQRVPRADHSRCCAGREACLFVCLQRMHRAATQRGDTSIFRPPVRSKFRVMSSARGEVAQHTCVADITLPLHHAAPSGRQHHPRMPHSHGCRLPLVSHRQLG